MTLRIPTDVEVARFADALAAGGLDDDQARSAMTWQPASPHDAAVERVSYQLRFLSAPSTAEWGLPLVMFVDGAPIGSQVLRAEGPFSTCALVSTGSFMLNTHRGRGFGTHARAAALGLAWSLGAVRAATGWREHNTASASVSAKLGYVRDANLERWEGPSGSGVVVRASVTPELFAAAWTGPVEVSGVDGDVRRWLHCPGAVS